jgi:hypothetical protein
MSLFDDASLVMIPIAYKDGKLYSIKPTDGSGDFTAQVEQGLVATDYIETTTTTAQAGILEDMPRLDYSGGASCPSLLLEPQRTNVVPYSEYFGAWTKSAVTITANAEASPDGYTNADKLIATASSGFHSMSQTIGSKIALTPYTFSFFAKADEIGFCVPNISSAFSGAQLAALINLSDGTASGVSAGLSVSTEDYGNGWYRIKLTATSQNNTSSFLVTINATNASGVSNFAGDGTSGILLYGAQLEQGSYATSYIPTYGTSVTFASDTAINQANSNLPTGYPFSLFAEVDVIDTSSGHAITLLDSSNSTSYYTIDYHSNVWRITARPNTEIARISSTSAPTLGTHKLIGIYTDSTMKLYLDGALIASGNNTETWNTNIDDLLLGQLRTVADTGTRNPVREALIFNQELTNEEAIALTQV